MATKAPLLGGEKKGGHSKASIFYGADEYLEELKRKYAHDHEIAALKNLLPGEGDPNAAGVAASQDKMLKVEKNNENRSLKTNRLFPTANKPDPMPQNLAFLFTKITPEQMIYMWNVLTAIFVTQVLMVIGYSAALATFPEHWWTCTLLFGIPFSYIAIQKMHFPDEGAGGKCNKDFWNKWVPRRLKHNGFVLSLWACVWLLGTYPLGRPLSEGWRFMFTVSFFARIGFSAAWMFITNFTHSLPWNEFLAQDPGRTWPVLHNVMALVLGGKHRWNEMLFHDVHHAFPNAVGTLSQRGRFHGWEKVHDAAAEVLHRGLWKPNGDEETQMQKTQKKRSLMMKQNK